MGLSLGSCARPLANIPVPIKDMVLFVDKGDAGAVSFNFLTPGENHYSKSDWDSLRFGMVCESPEAFGNIKAELEKLCSEVKCDLKIVLMIEALNELKAHTN